MDYQDILEKNIQDTRKEFHEVVNMLSKIKGEYNDLFSRKNKVEIEIIRLNNEYLYKFTELSDIEVKIDEYKANNLQKISKI
jgi:predicted nuclease with TOPRIM domain